MYASAPTLARYTSEIEMFNQALSGDDQAVNHVIKYLSSSNQEIRRIAHQTIRVSSDVRILEKLIYCLAKHRWDEKIECDRLLDEEGCRRFIASVNEFFTTDKTEAECLSKDAILQQYLNHPDEHFQFTAAYLMAMRNIPGMLPYLRRMIHSNVYRWQFLAIEALAFLRVEDCGSLLIEALASEDDKVHKAARQALSELGSIANPAWTEALSHPNSHVRWHAARALSESGDHRHINILAEGLRDENLAVRWAAARALANLDAKAVPGILSVLTHHKLTEPLRQAAHHALNSMVNRRTHARVTPLIEALNNSAASVQVPLIAQRLLNTWDVK